MLPAFRSLATWTLVLVLMPSAGLAATLPVEGYSLRVWQTEDGLPQNAVPCATQTRDGYMWIATFGGLARFDGDQFEVFDPANSPELQDGRVVSLFEDDQDTLWIGHESGAITHYRDDRFESFELPSEGSHKGMRAIGSDEQGHLWVLRDSGALDSLDGTHVDTLVGQNNPGILCWTRSSRGTVWLVEEHEAARLVDGKLVPLTFDEPSRNESVLWLAAARDGGVWVLRENGAREWKDGRWTEERHGDPWREGSISCGLELQDGTLAIGTADSGLQLIFGDGRPPVHFDRSNGLPQDWVRFLYEDREGNLWFGVGSAGLAAIHTSAFSVVRPPDQWQGSTVLSVAPGHDGALWVGTEGAGLYHVSAGTWTRYAGAEGLGNPYIWAVTEDLRGHVWAGTWTGGPYRLDHGRFVAPGQAELAVGAVLALCADPKTGGLFVGGRDGLLLLQDDHAEWLIRATDDFSASVSAVVRDQQGDLWVGFTQEGLARLTDGKLSRFRQKDGLPGNAVQCLLPDVDGSLWIGTADNGLSRLKNGRFANMGAAQGLTSNAVCQILDDGLGFFWLSTRHGIQRVAKDELNRCADQEIPVFSSEVYDRSDGLPTIEFTGGLQAAGCKTTDGRLWFPSSKGLVAVDPARIQSNPVRPPVVLEALLVDGKTMPLSAGADPLRLPPDHQRLEFRYSGLSFVAPGKVQCRYRLDGLDKVWVDAGTKRSAFYSHLPAGKYRFRVIACNNDGLWNTEGAAIAFAVAPFFWQTWWFLSSCALFVLSAVALFARSLTRRRLHRRLEQLERRYAVERERARIAQDIHDDIGTTVSRIAMLSQPTRRELDQPHQPDVVLSRIYSSAREVTRSLDEIVWAIDPRHDTLDSLTGYMGTFAQDLLGGADIRCRLDLPVDVPAWPLTAEIRHNLFLAFKEALTNVLKHAAATEVRVSLHVRPASFVLKIEDNGRGFAPDRPGRPAPGRIISGNGLPNMTRRLASIGGRCEISGETNQGTSVSLIVEIPDAGTAHPRPPGSV